MASSRPHKWHCPRSTRSSRPTKRFDRWTSHQPNFLTGRVAWTVSQYHKLSVSSEFRRRTKGIPNLDSKTDHFHPSHWLQLWRPTDIGHLIRATSSISVPIIPITLIQNTFGSFRPPSRPPSPIHLRHPSVHRTMRKNTLAYHLSSAFLTPNSPWACYAKAHENCAPESPFHILRHVSLPLSLRHGPCTGANQQFWQFHHTYHGIDACTSVTEAQLKLFQFQRL